VDAIDCAGDRWEPIPGIVVKRELLRFVTLSAGVSYRMAIAAVEREGRKSSDCCSLKITPVRIGGSGWAPEDGPSKLTPVMPSPTQPRSRGLIRHGNGGFILMVWGIEAWGSHVPKFAGLPLYWTVQTITWIAFAWLLNSADDSPRALRGLLLWALLFRVAASATNPLMENDYARHLWDGWQTLSSGTPYNKAPAASFRDPSVPDSMQSVLSEINYPDIPTIYSPVLQGWCALAAAIQPGALWPFKSLLILADLLVIACLWRNASPRAAVLYGWCPLVIHEVSANAHADILALAPLVLGWTSLRSDRPVRGGVLVGMAVATKLTAWLAVPFLIPFRSWKGWIGAAAGMTVPYLPYWLQGSTAEWEGMLRFAGSWEFNSSVFGALQWVFPPQQARQIAGMGAAGILAALAWKWRSCPLQKRRIEWVFGTALIFSAVVNPWYLIWLAPFSACSAHLRSTGIVWIAMVAVSLSYATALNLGISGQAPFNHPGWVRPAEYGLIGLAAIWIAASTGSEPKRSRDSEDSPVAGVPPID